MTVIEAKNLCRRFGRNLALKDVSFSVREKEVVGLIGPNGAGKTTTMNILCGYLPPTSGSVTVCGIDMAQHSADARRHIGYLPETPPLYPDMTVEEQVRFACALGGLKKGKALEERVDALCEKTHIENMRKRLIKSLSKGYRQRTAMAQLLADDPDILILDEPTAGLDPRQIREFCDLFAELGRSHTVIFSSHILPEISSICDRILIFEQGRLLADGSPEELHRQLSTETVMRLRTLGGENSLTEKIGMLPAVVSVSEVPCKDPQAREFLITAMPDTDPARALNGILRREGCDILMLREEEMSLEDIYLGITEKRSGYEDNL